MIECSGLEHVRRNEGRIQVTTKIEAASKIKKSCSMQSVVHPSFIIRCFIWWFVDFLRDDVVSSVPHSRRTHHDIPLDSIDLLTSELLTRENPLNEPRCPPPFAETLGRRNGGDLRFSTARGREVHVDSRAASAAEALRGAVGETGRGGRRLRLARSRPTQSRGPLSIAEIHRTSRGPPPRVTAAAQTVAGS
jgi:hypothetical protein